MDQPVIYLIVILLAKHAVNQMMQILAQVVMMDFICLLQILAYPVHLHVKLVQVLQHLAVVASVRLIIHMIA